MKKAEGVLKLHVSPWVGRESITGFILYNEHYRTVYSLYSILEWIPYEVGTYVISCNRSTFNHQGSFSLLMGYDVGLLEILRFKHEDDYEYEI